MTQERAIRVLKDDLRVSYRDEKREALGMAINVLQQFRWIPVSERLPEDGSDILAYYDNGTETRIIACNYYKGEWFDCVFNTETVFKYITHWMPLPKPPKKGDGDE